MLIDWLLGSLSGPEWNRNKLEILNCIDEIIRLASTIEGYLQRIFQPNGERPNEVVILNNILQEAGRMEENKNNIQNLIQSESSTKKLSSVKRSLIERLDQTQKNLYSSILELRDFVAIKLNDIQNRRDIFSERDRQELLKYVNKIRNSASSLKEIINQIV
ncbi:MAG: hypothetical protein RQ894_01580 [Candidatus Pacebacteria bacterium]|nr:hypothetical protein [Candidatus Paceibacterota bacterium]